MTREYPKYLVSHADHGDPECCGLIFTEVTGDVANFFCNECGAVVRIVPADQADRTWSEMASTEMTSATCPYCDKLNIIQGFSSVDAFICRHCGKGVSVKRNVQ